MQPSTLKLVVVIFLVRCLLVVFKLEKNLIVNEFAEERYCLYLHSVLGFEARK